MISGTRISILCVCLLASWNPGIQSVNACDDQEKKHDHYLESYLPSRVPDRIVLTWSGDPATSQAVTWRTSEEVVEGFAELVVADASSDYNKSATRFTASTTVVEHDERKAHFHTVNFVDLKPATKYLYRVGISKHWSEWSMFETAHDSNAPFSFVYFGDSQNDIKSKWSRVVRESFRISPDSKFLLHTGDLVNTANSDKEWGQWFYSAGWINRRIGVIASPGNHEHNNGISKFWRPSFEFPLNGPDGFEETAYYIDYQGTRIISLNSTRELDPQVEWLRKVLNENDMRWTIVCMHHPIFSSAKGRDNVELREKLQPVFDEFSVDLVLQGHDHTYARTPALESVNVAAGTNQVTESGTVYVVSVSGPKMYRSQSRPMFSRIAEGTQLFQIITIEKDQLNFRAMTATGELYDQFKLEKSSDGTNLFVEQTPPTPQRRLPTIPLVRAHSHNDYYQERPLLDALENGFCSVETDVFLNNGQLKVAHTILELNPEKTLKSLYLEPLFERFKKHDGRIYQKESPFTLLIDFKSDPSTTYDALKQELEPYQEMLTRFEDGQTIAGAVTIVISGKRPIDKVQKDQRRWVAIDGRMGELANKSNSQLYPMISDRWSSHFEWNGEGEMPEDQLARLKDLVEQAHEQKKTIRFWGVPDVEACWKVLFDAGVDHINTDKIHDLGEFLRSK